MKITEVRIFKVNNENKENRVKGIATITIEDCFAVHGIKILDGRNGLFVVMPSKLEKTGGYRDIAHPINSETREMIQNTIIEEYKKICE